MAVLTVSLIYPENPTVPVLSSVTVDGGKLFIDKVPATPLSETRFSLSGQRIEFVKDAQGNVTHYVTLYVEGDLRSVKTPDARQPGRYGFQLPLPHDVVVWQEGWRFD